MGKKLLFLFLFLASFFASTAQPVTVVGTATVCRNTSIKYFYSLTIGGRNVVSHQWTFQGGVPGTSSALDTTNFIQYPDTGIFNTDLLITYDDGSDTLVRFIVTVFDTQLPSNLLGNDTTYCGNFTRTLNAGNTGSQFTWSPGGQTTQSITVSQPGQYSVNIKNQCQDATYQINLAQSPPVNVDLGPDAFVCNEDGKILDAGPGDTYLWQPGNETTRTITINLSGTYSVFVTNTFGCSDQDEIVLRDSCPPTFYFPNAFTPNADKINDTLLPSFTGVAKIEFWIFNMWGEQVFYSNDITKGWDGNYKGQPCQIGNYIWIYSFLSTGGEKRNERGNVMLLR